MKQRRTLLTAGVFAVLAMIYVPTPRHGYRFIFSQEDTSIAFFQLLVNVVFAALLGAILATIIPKIVTGVRRLPKWVWQGIGGITLMAVGAAGWWSFTEAAHRDERYANELLQERHNVFDQFDAEIYFRNAARNWRLALRFDEATRVENRIKELQQHPARDWHNDPVVDLSGPTPLPSRDTFDQTAKDVGFVPDVPGQQPASTPKKYISGDPNFGLTPIPRARPVRSPQKP